MAISALFANAGGKIRTGKYIYYNKVSPRKVTPPDIDRIGLLYYDIRRKSHGIDPCDAPQKENLS